jgi:hypothetical protein
MAGIPVAVSVSKLENSCSIAHINNGDNGWHSNSGKRIKVRELMLHSTYKYGDAAHFNTFLNIPLTFGEL